MKDEMLLPPGMVAPAFELPAANRDGAISNTSYEGQIVVLLFWPANPEAALIDQLAQYEGKLDQFAAHNARLIGISAAEKDELNQLSEQQQISFPLLSDSSPPLAISTRYGLVAADNILSPALFILDEAGLVRRVYEPSKYPHLPNPAMVLRAIKKLKDVPRPAPITVQDWQSGPHEAPVTVIEYADYQCDPCREAYRLLKQIIPAYRDKILWIHRHLPLRHSHPLAHQAAEAAEAAGVQGKFWQMHDRLFEAEGALAREELIEYAQEIGLDVERFSDDLDNRRFREAVNEDFKQAVKNKIKLPPALFINQIPFEVPRTAEALKARIDCLVKWSLS